MSNAVVGAIYQQIIADVIETSRMDLEENGVDESVLEELRQGWQRKLTQQGLAAFPWDPTPEPPPAPVSAPAPAVPQSAPAPAQSSTNPIANGSGGSHQRNGGAQPSAVPFPAGTNQPIGDGRIKAEPGVKVEPGLENAPSVPHINSTNNSAVQARVINNLQTAFGDRATVTVQKLQETMGPSNTAQFPGQQRPAGQSMPQQPHPQFQAQAHQQYRQQLAAGQQQQRMPHPQAAQNGQKPAASQMDGSGEDGYSGVLMHQDAAGHTTELGRVEIDRLLHAQIQARAKSMEGGGLMLPLKRKAKRNPVSYHRAQSNPGPSRFDGVDDDLKSEDDDEAINSDLDDSDENLEDDDEDEDGGQMMLCMYDKVQRVKNKWKCVLKDGVLSVNGKDYVFHKATGEYEW